MLSFSTSKAHRQSLSISVLGNLKFAGPPSGEKNAKFGLEEFIFVTGLNADDDNDVDKALGEECRIVKEYFKNSGGKITKGDASNVFVNCKKRKSDKYKLGLIVILAYVLWATEENTYIDLWWLDLVDDVDRFETYPWGKFSFEYMISIFKREMGDKLKSLDVEGESCCRYSLHDFPLAIMIWAFEAIPTLGMKFGMKYPDVIQRMVAWEMPKRLTSAAIENVLNSKELEVNSTLIPTEAELEEAYWKELKPIVEEDESVSHHSEGDEAEQDVHIMHTTKSLLEQLNHHNMICLKEDSKLEEEEEVRGKNVGGKELETEPGFDDVRDVPAVETNVEAREEDPKLEEEVRGKNVGGKDLEKEAGSGNDIDEQENEKMIKESVGKEIILEEEHPDVKKGTADFVTPEKYDVDTNEST
ncbi:Hypothetical predicted protein [Olea europaea subsp. europaea]|uniref:DUF1985 domain-containing protein n=1 Tax=Olea europaea subsp. europaea TaxID=158383 RepID=A0A8S0V0J5_OLEEU|nr:Hypothetical predicted protein [Olea europaea subsp. europaea]